MLAACNNTTEPNSTSLRALTVVAARRPGRRLAQAHGAVERLVAQGQRGHGAAAAAGQILQCHFQCAGVGAQSDVLSGAIRTKGPSPSAADLAEPPG
ncbi:jg22810 [Pararge aegeria aegeria]|uniref:Jg22810 protein n=1 Tax=Pararge aegeria aegeria TaxID=348720 RepID=A0A8S4RUF6_9NEOP|nr:jg22810 [Pararge aegeria aegeria]